MELDVLVIGQSEFVAIVAERYRNFTSTMRAVDVPSEMVSCIQQEKPDVVVLSLADHVNLKLVQSLKYSNFIDKLYCIILDVQPSRAKDQPVHQVCRAAEVIESGASAYVRIYLEDCTIEMIDAEERLLQAHCQTAVQQVVRYRELTRTNNLLSTIALSDPLTNLSNRRALEWDLPRQAQRAKLRDQPLSLIILDVDYFKLVNDNYGHPVGDRVLRLLANRLASNVRNQDVVFRYGGEEFVVVLRKTELVTAAAIAERLRVVIQSKPFTTNEGLELAITISLGVASLRPTDDDRGKSLLHRADQHLLSAKSQGRNRVICDRSSVV